MATQAKRCFATTIKGAQCKRMAGPSCDFCKQHLDMYNRGMDDTDFHKNAYRMIISYRRAKIAEDKIKNAMKPVSAIRIQRVWRRVNTDPKFKACKNRLVREFQEL